jgi:ribonuclease HI
LIVAKVDKFFGIFFLLFFINNSFIFSQQYQSFEIKDGDTINVIDNNGNKQGIWRTYWSNGDLRSECFYIDNKKIFQHHSSIGIATNNDAEYQALIFALEEIKKQKERLMKEFKINKIEFFSDSYLLVNQVKGFFKVKNGKIKEYIFKIKILEQEINLPIFYYLIPREKNKEADRLTNLL